MNLRQLEAFRAVILGQTVTRAAEMLCISQPAATRLIASLEEDIGFSLFDRIKGRLQPTPEAMTLYQEVQRSLLGVERIARTAQDILWRRTKLGLHASDADRSRLEGWLARHLPEGQTAPVAERAP